MRVVGFPESEAPRKGGAVDELLKPGYQRGEGRDGGSLRKEGRAIIFHQGEEEVRERGAGAVLAKVGKVVVHRVSGASRSWFQGGHTNMSDLVIGAVSEGNFGGLGGEHACRSPSLRRTRHRIWSVPCWRRCVDVA